MGPLEKVYRARQMAQPLRVLTVLAEDLDSICSNYTEAQFLVIPVLGDLTFSLADKHTVYVLTYRCTYIRT